MNLHDALTELGDFFFIKTHSIQYLFHDFNGGILLHFRRRYRIRNAIHSSHSDISSRGTLDIGTKIVLKGLTVFCGKAVSRTNKSDKKKTQFYLKSDVGDKIKEMCRLAGVQELEL